MEFDKKKAVSFSMVVLTLLLLGNLYFLYDTNQKMNEFSETSRDFQAFENTLSSETDENTVRSKDNEEKINELESRIDSLNETVQYLKNNP